MHLGSRDAFAFDQPGACPLGYCDNGGGLRVKRALELSEQPKGKAISEDAHLGAVVGPDASLGVVRQRSERAHPVAKCDPETTKVQRPGGGRAGLGVEVVREIANVEAGHAGQGLRHYAEFTATAGAAAGVPRRTVWDHACRFRRVHTRIAQSSWL